MRDSEIIKALSSWREYIYVQKQKGSSRRKTKESNIQCKLSDERFMKMSASYEQEQENLVLTIAECEQALKEADKAKVDLRMLLKGLRDLLS